MKTCLTTLLVGLLALPCLAQPNNETVIKRVIVDETNAFINREFDKQMAFYAHEPYTTLQFNKADGSVTKNEGWTAISSDMKAYYKANPKEHFAKVERSNWKLKMMSPDWCWVRFDQVMIDANQKAGKSTENRLMQRIGGQWKIASMVALWEVDK